MALSAPNPAWGEEFVDQSEEYTATILRSEPVESVEQISEADIAKAAKHALWAVVAEIEEKGGRL